jgi:hypothetical protein
VVLGAGGLLVAAGGVASGVGALAGVGAGLVLGLGSFVAWGIGNSYQRLATDPPRDDFDQVTVSAAQLNQAALPQDPALATAASYAANQLILADVLDALVTSLERFDGAVAAGDTSHASAQADAVSSNAAAVVSTQQALIDQAAALNDVWTHTLPTVDTSVVSFDKVAQFLSDTVAADGAGITTVLPCVEGLTGDPLAGLDPSAHPLATQGALPASPTELASGAWTAALAAVSSPLGGIVDAGNA